MKNELHLFHEMQEISINLPIIFKILSLIEDLSREDKMRLNIENNYAFGKTGNLVFRHCKILLTGCIGRR